MEGVWRGSHVDRGTSWYCTTYKVKNLTPMCISLTTRLSCSFAQMDTLTANFPRTAPAKGFAQETLGEHGMFIEFWNIFLHSSTKSVKKQTWGKERWSFLQGIRKCYEDAFLSPPLAVRHGMR